MMRRARALRRALSLLLVGGVAVVQFSLCASAADSSGGGLSRPEPAVLIQRELRQLASTGRVLHIAAHPDDENTQLIAYLSLARGYDTAYLSITRGDGGQNLLGPQFDEKLGVARTQELLVARRIDGGRQFFTRAIDFGFSKDPQETLRFWGRDEVLSDVVRIVRRFRPDVIVTRFPTPPGSGGHGHHTASAMLAVEAFRLAGRPEAFPEQLQEGLEPWQPRRVVWNHSGFSRGGGLENNPSIKVDIGGDDPASGEPLGMIAARSRSMHKTQAFGEFAGRGSSGARLETFVHLEGEPAREDLLDGVDTSWARISGGEKVGEAIRQVLASFAPANPAASVPALLAIRQQLAALPDSVIVQEKRRQLDEVLRRCLGLKVRTTSRESTATPGQRLRVTATVDSPGRFPVEWVGVQFGPGGVEVRKSVSKPEIVTHDLTYPVNRDAPVTQPYWLRLPGTEGLSHVADPALIGRPENPPDLPLAYVFSIDGQTLRIADRVLVAASADEAEPDAVAIVPQVSLRFEPGAAVFRPGEAGPVVVEAMANEANLTGRVSLVAPAGWRVSPPQPIHLAKAGERVRLTFDVVPPAGPAVATIGAQADTGGMVWNTDTVTVAYPHIPRQVLQPTARKRAVSVDVAIRGRTIGFVPGAGDDTAEALRQIGYDVNELQGDELQGEALAKYDAIVVGVRAFNTRNDLSQLLPALFGYVEQGGTVVTQYNWARNLKTEQVAPYPLKIAAGRVTDETAEVTMLAPDHPVLTSPNRIGPADFRGWVQERGIYFPSEWDERFTPVLSMADPGEAPQKGALLVARHGKGWFVYTGLAFFRQLPAGVPGAYRLFANLVSLGDAPATVP